MHDRYMAQVMDDVAADGITEEELRAAVPYLHVVTHVEPLEDPRSFADTGLDPLATPPSARPLAKGEPVPPYRADRDHDEKDPPL